MARNVGDWLEDPARFAEMLQRRRVVRRGENRGYFGTPDTPGQIYQTMQYGIDVWTDLGCSRRTHPANMIATDLRRVAKRGSFAPTGLQGASNENQAHRQHRSRHLRHGRPDGRTQAEPLRIGYSIWVGFGPLFVAKEKGLFAKEGVEVELIERRSTAALYRRAAGRAIEVSGWHRQRHAAGF